VCGLRPVQHSSARDRPQLHNELLSCQLFQIFGRIFVKVFAACLAAELDLLALVFKDNGFAHLPELVTRDDTGAGFVGLVVVMSVMGAQRGRQGQGEYGDEGREYDVGCLFHVRFDWKMVLRRSALAINGNAWSHRRGREVCGLCGCHSLTGRH